MRGVACRSIAGDAVVHQRSSRQRGTPACAAMGTAALALFLISAVASAQGPPPEAPAIPIPGAPPSAKEPPPVTLGPLGAGPIVPAPLPGAPSAPKQGPPRKISIHSR